MKFSIKDFVSKYETADLVTFTEEIFNGKKIFFVQCSIVGYIFELHMFCNTGIKKKTMLVISNKQYMNLFGET